MGNKLAKNGRGVGSQEIFCAGTIIGPVTRREHVLAPLENGFPCHTRPTTSRGGNKNGHRQIHHHRRRSDYSVFAQRYRAKAAKITSENTMRMEPHRTAKKSIVRISRNNS